MKAILLEPLLRDATIRTIDGISRKLSTAEEKTETMVSRLLKRWNDMTPAEKENVVGVVIATASAAVTAIAAAKSKAPKKMAKKVGKKVVKKVAKKFE
jgi:hypothetical protein